MAPRLTALLFAALCVVAATARPCLKDWTERVEAIEHDFVSHFVQKESDCQSALDVRAARVRPACDADDVRRSLRRTVASQSWRLQ